MPRQINAGPRQKKLRGIPRRLRALKTWASRFNGYFPSQEELHGQRYWNWKIPVHWGLVEGRYTNSEIQKECAQSLINACSSLIKAKPEWARAYRVTCCICIPNMFASELCIYLDEAYYQNHTAPLKTEYGYQELIEGRSLAAEWGRSLPPHVKEKGVIWCYNASEEGDDHDISQHWVYGEVS